MDKIVFTYLASIGTVLFNFTGSSALVGAGDTNDIDGGARSAAASGEKIHRTMPSAVATSLYKKFSARHKRFEKIDEITTEKRS